MAILGYPTNTAMGTPLIQPWVPHEYSHGYPSKESRDATLGYIIWASGFGFWEGAEGPLHPSTFHPLSESALKYHPSLPPDTLH